jgi:hypothetical protein
MAAQGTAEGSDGVLRPPRVDLLIRSASGTIAREWTDRRDNAWIGIVAVPLAMTATGLLGQWWSWPVLVIIAAAATRSWRWSWVLSIELGFVSTEWAFVGANALATWPSLLLPLGAVWAAFPTTLAVAVARHRHQAILGGFGRPASGPR